MHGRDMTPKGARGILIAVLLFLPGGCRTSAQAVTPPNAPIIRVKILAAQDQVQMAASHPPVFRFAGESRRLNFPPGDVPVTLSPQGWQIGNFSVAGRNELIVEPSVTGSVRVNGQVHRGAYRLVPAESGKFDVINDVDIDSYLKGVLAREIPNRWHAEAFKAQAVAARTYALYEARSAGTGRNFDVYADTRSQVYGGMGGETDKSVLATEQTAGVVLAWGPRGSEKIFKAYFSSTCGGIGQSAIEALGDSDIPPLRAKYVGSLCNASSRFNWPAVTIKKDELTRRIRAWGARRNRPEKDMAMLKQIDVSQVNRYGRPSLFILTDVRGARYSLKSEEMRWAANADANGGPTLPSSFFKPVNEADAIRFADGHGFGHGVGLCQYCTEALAGRGIAHEDILRHAYPGAVLVRAY